MAIQHVIVVAGTFDREGLWYVLKPNEGEFIHQLRARLSERSENEFRFHEFIWSGDNDHSARMEAAFMLASLVHQINTTEHPSKFELHLVGHSHGGSVILSAINYLFKVNEITAEGAIKVFYNKHDNSYETLHTGYGQQKGSVIVKSITLMATPFFSTTSWLGNKRPVYMPYTNLSELDSPLSPILKGSTSLLNIFYENADEAFAGLYLASQLDNVVDRVLGKQGSGGDAVQRDLTQLEGPILPPAMSGTEYRRLQQPRKNTPMWLIGLNSAIAGTANSLVVYILKRAAKFYATAKGYGIAPLSLLLSKVCVEQSISIEGLKCEQLPLSPVTDGHIELAWNATDVNHVISGDAAIRNLIDVRWMHSHIYKENRVVSSIASHIVSCSESAG